MNKDVCPHCGKVLTNMDIVSGTCTMCKKPISSSPDKTIGQNTHNIDQVLKNKNNIKEDVKSCPHCGRLLSEEEILSNECMICHNKIIDYNKNSNNLAYSQLNQTDILLTTAPYIEGYRIVETKDIIASECVIGMNVIKDIISSFRDVFGGRSKTVQKSLKEAKEYCMHELRLEAKNIGANAVIGVDLDYSEISSQGKSMLFLVMSGTAVNILKNT